MNQNIGDLYSKKGFVVIKNLINLKEIEKYYNIAKKYYSVKPDNPTVDYFYDYLRFFDFRLYPAFLNGLIRLFLDCYYLISKSKQKDWKSYMLSINNKKKIQLQELIATFQKNQEKIF